MPAPQHCAGPTHFVNGGILSTLIDCHCVCTATAAAYADAGRKLGSEPLLSFATTRLEIEFLRPTPIEAELVLDAQIAKTIPNGYRLNCRLNADDKLRVRGCVEAVQVSQQWMTRRD